MAMQVTPCDYASKNKMNISSQNELNISSAIHNNANPSILCGKILKNSELSSIEKTFFQYEQKQQDFGSEFMLDPSDGSPLLDKDSKPITIARFLATKPLKRDLCTRPGPGNRQLTYMSGECVTRTLNDVFGFDGWCLEVKNTSREESTKDEKGRYHVAYTACVRVTHRRSGAFREDCGAGDAIDKHLGTAVSNAMKASVTDAMKRAARHFGDKLGNSLYQGSFNIKKAPINLKHALEMFEREQKQSTGDINKKIAPASVPIKDAPSSMCIVTHNGIKVDSPSTTSSAPQTLMQSGEDMVNSQSFVSPRNVNKSSGQYPHNADYKNNSAINLKSIEKLPIGSNDSYTISAHKTIPNELPMTVSDQQKPQRIQSSNTSQHLVHSDIVTSEKISTMDQTPTENVYGEALVKSINSNSNFNRFNKGNPYFKEHKPKEQNSSMNQKHQEYHESYASNDFGNALANITNKERSRMPHNGNNKVSNNCLKRPNPSSSSSVCNKRAVTNPYNKLKSML